MNKEMNEVVHDPAADLPEGFQMTELGPLPKEWRVVRLGEFLQMMRNGLTYRQERNHKGVPVTRIETISEENINPKKVGYISGLDKSQIEKYRLLPGDILFSHINSEPHLGKTAIYQGNPPLILHGMNLLLLRAHPNVSDPYFLFYLLNYERSRGTFIGMAARAVGQSSINMGKLRNLPVFLPPLSEQRAIAYVLRTVQWAKEATDGVIAALKELKKSLMQHLFTYGPVPVTERERVALQETEIGPIPAHWQVVRLGELAEVRGGMAFPHRYQGQQRGKYPFYKVSDMNLPGNERYMQKANNWIDEQTIRELRAKPFVKNTVIFPKIGAAIHTNKKRILTRDALVDNNVMGVTICEHERCHPEYLFYWFESIDIARFSRPGPLPSITVQTLKDAMLPLSPLDEQREIARMLQAVDARIAAEQARRAALETLFKSLLHHLMTGKVRVNHLGIPEVSQDA